MKRFALFLLVVLLLSGCTVKQPPETVQSTPPSTKPSGLYDPESRIEKDTGGAVRVYPLKESGWTALYGMGSHLLLVNDEKMMTLTGDEGVLEATIATGKGTDVSGINTAVTGMGYYLPNTREVVICNPQLQIVSRLSMPEEMTGEPVICMARNEIFYATETQIRAIDLQSGISRLIREQSAPGQMELQCHFEGELLACQFTDADGQKRTEYLSSQTGQSYTEKEGISALQSWRERYFARYSDGVETQLIFGSKEGSVQVIELPQYADAAALQVTAVLEQNGVLVLSQTESENTVSLFDLEEGKQTAQITLTDVELPGVFLCDGTYIWFLAVDAADGQQILCRWEPEMSSVPDTGVYTHPLYTADNPDVAGIAACRKQADALESEYGITIAIWDEVEKYVGEFDVVPEHSTKRIEAMLADLKYGLSLFPNQFLHASVGDGDLTVSLVRNVEGREGAQYWQDGDCVLLLPSENTLYAFFRTVAYAVDSYVLGNSRDLDSWDQLNPEGFEYIYSFEIPEQAAYLEGEDRAFVDCLAMAYPNEDRCSTFACAMLPGNETVFESDSMQSKLRQLCLGIREAYGLEQNSEIYPWEQYLRDTLAAEDE